MTKTPAWRRYLRFWRPNIAADVDDELRFHADMRVAEYMARGMSEADARRAVAERLGDVDAARDDCIEQGKIRAIHARNADFFDGLRSDLKYAVRSLGRAPAWTAVALLTIALGVGATTTVFRVADALLLRPIQYPRAGRIFIAHREMTIGGGKAYAPLPMGALNAWRTDAYTIEAAAPFWFEPVDFGDSTEAVGITALRIDTTFLAFAGARPIIGRNFVAAETMPNGPRAVMLAESFWRRQYGGSTDVIGKVVRLDNQPHTIVGVLPSSVSIPQFRIEPADIWLPLVEQQARFVTGIMVRLRPDVGPEAARAELDTVFQRAQLGEPRGVRGLAAPRVIPMRLVLTRPGDDLGNRQSLVMLMCAVGLLLLVACSNVAHLLLARGASRQRELAVRHALGAARRRLVRQLVTESLVIATIGAVLAMAVGWVGLVILSALRPVEMVALAYVSTGRGVLTIASALAIGCGLTIGLLAALRTAGQNVGASLRSGATVIALGSTKLRATLVIGEVALSATLLVGALLLTHAVIALQHVRLGFDARGLYGLSFEMRRGSTPAERAAFVAELRERALHIPAVEGAALALAAPQPHYWRMLSSLETPEHPVTERETQGTATNSVGPGYFAMIGMPVLAGHTFDEGSAERNEAIVSISLARQLWPNKSPLGRRFRNGLPAPDGSHEPWKTVIGVVPDMVQDLLEGPARQAIYGPLLTTDPRSMQGGNTVTLLVRLRPGVSASVVDRIHASVAAGSTRPVITNVRESIDKSMAEPRFMMQVLATFAALGVLLSAIGLFGVISYSVAQRTREIGVRMTLGASRASIARLVVGDGLRLAIIGIALGLLGATAATRLIQSALYGVSRLDPLSFALGATLLLAVAVVACAVPMWRATAVDPLVAVRAD